MFYIGGLRMKLNKIIVEKLHNYYDYTVNFNTDVTFLYGENGCGKTTLLDIITSIITGELYHLFGLNFKQITLFYTNNDTVQNIVISYNDQNILVKFLDNQHTLERLTVDSLREERSDDLYFRKYEFLLDIKKCFTSVYLPLNRKNSNNEYKSMYYRKYVTTANYFSDRQYDRFLYEVLEIIREKYTEISGQINTIDENFKKDIIDSVLDLNEDTSKSIINSLTDPEYINGLDEIKKEYIYALDNYLELNTIKNRKQVDKFFDSFKKGLEALSKTPKPSESLTVDLVFKFKDLAKINKVINVVKQREQSITDVKLPITKYLDIVNNYISTNQNKKKIKLNTKGMLYLELNEEDINIRNLSSGEKQIVTFFAHIIFSLYDKPGIFVADEPELSLHLNWQKKFVESILKANPNLQVIFATHAPEIIGKYRDKAVKLEPTS